MWRWTLLSYIRIVEDATPTRGLAAYAIFVSFALAAGTYFFVERPIRFGEGGRLKVLCLVLLMAIIFLVGYETYRQEGIKSREAAYSFQYEGDTEHTKYFDNLNDNYFPCTPASIATEALRWEGRLRCLQSKNRIDIDMALIGDSHAEHLFHGLAQALPNKNIAYYIKAAAPWVDDSALANIYGYVLSNERIKTVVIGAWWDEKVNMVPKASTLENKMSKTVRLFINGRKKVYLMGDIPTSTSLPVGVREGDGV